MLGDAAAVRAMLREAGVVAPVTRVTRRAGGELGDVFEVRVRDRPDPLILKVYAPEWRWKQRKELYVYGLLREALGEHIPEPLAAVDATGSVGEAFTVMTRIPGQPLSQVAPRIAPRDMADVYAQMGALIARVHEVAQPAFGYIVEEILDPSPTNAGYMRRQFERKLGEYRALGGDPGLAAQIADAHRRADAGGVFDACGGAVLCHNDFHEGNVLVERDPAGRWHVRGLIDVENAIAAEPLLDLAKTLAYSVHGDHDKVDGLTAGYPELQPGWHDAEPVRLYRLYHALELWDWFASIDTHGPLAAIATDLAALSAS